MNVQTIEIKARYQNDPHNTWENRPVMRLVILPKSQVRSYMKRCIPQWLYNSRQFTNPAVEFRWRCKRQLD